MERQMVQVFMLSLIGFTALFYWIFNLHVAVIQHAATSQEEKQ